MELLESDFAQIEHLNQIVYNNPRHTSWECFDTQCVIEEFPGYAGTGSHSGELYHDVVDMRYNTLLVNVTHSGSSTEYVFDVRNALWTGNYRIVPTSEEATLGDDEVLVSAETMVGKRIMFTVSGNHRNSVRICFEMSNVGSGCNVKTNSIYIDCESEYEHQFDKAVVEEGRVLTDIHTPVTGATVTLTPCNEHGLAISTGLPKQVVEAYDVREGKFRMTYGATSSVGVYYALLEAEYLHPVTNQVLTAVKIVKVNKVQNNRIIPDIVPQPEIVPKESYTDWGNDEQYKRVLKGSVKTFKINLVVKDKYGEVNDDYDYLNGLYATVTAHKITGGVLDSQTCTFVKDENGFYYVEATMSYRGYYEDTSTLQISIPAQNGYSAITKERLVSHKWYVARNEIQLRSELNRENGADWIFIYSSQIELNSTLTIQPRSDGSRITLAGVKGNQNCILKGDGTFNLINIFNSNAAKDNYFKVQLIGITLTKGSPAVKLSTGCRLLVDRCYFYDNNHTGKHHKGCSIYMPSDDASKSNQELWKTEIRRSVFFNNKGNEIYSLGETYIHNNLFRTNKASCLQQPEVKVVNVTAGSVRYMRNKSHIDIGNTPLASNHSYAKALAYVDKKGKFNGKGPNQLGRNNSLPLFGHPWYNEAYTYAIYYYPYGPRTVIVCSPKRGYERKATGHSSTFTNWVFYDGYEFVLFNKGRNRGNTNRTRWTESELATPVNQGIYDLENEVFEKGYNPAVSRNHSLNSSLDSDII
ncbi:MAG: hypothetical protein BZ136_07560 [Methanosphaera sp. rholeuAM74]|nr:MAG: hypothetical protein BZ136_07560 [Methanosphaera sp. rholeuAM74]